MTDELIKQINDSIKWLAENPHTNNVVKIVKLIDKLTVSAMTLGESVSQAYSLMNNAEDEYKIAVAKFISKAKTSAAKAERDAEAKYSDLKLEWTSRKNLYKRYDTFLDRIDKICDSYRQRVSVLKQTDLKHL